MEDKRKDAGFLDMDGTIIETKSGHTFPIDEDDWEFKSGILDKLRFLNENFDFVFIVSNQGGIEAGHYKHEDVRIKFDFIKKCLKESSIIIDDMHFSPYNSYHYNRKPNPEFAYRMAIKYQLDLSKCVMIGDASGIEISDLVGTLTDKDGLRFVTDNLKLGVTGSCVPEEYMDKIEENEIGIKYINYRKDFSNSDLMFAINSGMRYMDIEEFLTKNFESKVHFMFYSQTK